MLNEEQIKSASITVSAVIRDAVEGKETPPSVETLTALAESVAAAIVAGFKKINSAT